MSYPLPSVSDWRLAVFLISFLKSHPDCKEEAKGSRRGLELPASCLRPAGLGARVEDFPPAVQKSLWKFGQSYLSVFLYTGCCRNALALWHPLLGPSPESSSVFLRAPGVLLIASCSWRLFIQAPVALKLGRSYLGSRCGWC